MKVYGINPNCSEAVIRLKKVDYERVKREIIAPLIKKIEKGELNPMQLLFMGSEQSFGYSDMVPTNDDEICLYYGQTSGRGILEELINRKIPHDTHQWTVGWEDWRDDYIKITMEGNVLIKDLEGVHPEEGEYHDYWRRKLYQE